MRFEPIPNTDIWRVTPVNAWRIKNREYATRVHERFTSLEQRDNARWTHLREENKQIFSGCGEIRFYFNGEGGQEMDSISYCMEPEAFKALVELSCESYGFAQ